MVSSYTANAIDFYDQMCRLVEDHSAWSQATFGSDEERGAIGPLKHLAKEAMEVVRALESGDSAAAEMELADCFMLMLDAMRRMKMKLGHLATKTQEKLEINKKREWPKADPNEPVFHTKSEDEANRTVELQVSSREWATMLAAMRYWQEEKMPTVVDDGGGGDLREIATEGGEFLTLDENEIDELIERLN